MTQRSILAGPSPLVIIKAGGSVTVKGYESDLIKAQVGDPAGLKVERRSTAEMARARAAVGDHVLFDLRLKLPDFSGAKTSEEAIEVQIGRDGEVLVPRKSNLKVYAAKDIDVQDIDGQVDGYAGLNLRFREVFLLNKVSAGGSMDLDCRTVNGDKIEFKCGRDLRFHIQDLTSAQIRVKDLGGYWEARIGSGEKLVYLKCGGDVTLITDQKVEPLAPDYILGRIERPPSG